MKNWKGWRYIEISLRWIAVLFFLLTIFPLAFDSLFSCDFFYGLLNAGVLHPLALILLLAAICYSVFGHYFTTFTLLFASVSFLILQSNIAIACLK